MAVVAEKVCNTWWYSIFFLLNLNLWNIGLNDESIVDNTLPGSPKWLGACKETMALINTRERTYTKPRLSNKQRTKVLKAGL